VYAVVALGFLRDRDRDFSCPYHVQTISVIIMCSFQNIKDEINKQ
jgi:hypothetical protein